MHTKSNGWGLVRSFSPNPLTKPRLTPIGFYCNLTMKKLPLFITACLLVSFFSGCDEWKGSSKTEPQPKSKPEPQPEKPNTYTESPSVACSADGKTVYWISNYKGSQFLHFRYEMYKSEDGGKTWREITPYPPINYTP